MEALPQIATLASPATLAAELDLSVSGFWRLIHQPGFPPPIRLGPRCTRFDRAAVMAWAKSRGAGTPKSIGKVA